ncbi:MAG: BACON domain-containing protein [Alistipes sp.]|nr:BACON domain-containing protein [Alistipes sp.]
MRFFSSFMIYAATLLLGVACGSDPIEEKPKPEPTPDPEPTIPSLVVDKCDVLPATAGEYSLGYTLENPVEGVELLVGEPSAEWLHDFEVVVNESLILFSYDANDEEPGSEPREASFTVTCTNATTNSVDVTIVAKDPEMRFVVGKLSEASLSEFESKEAWAEYYVTDRLAYWYETSTFVGSFPSEGINNTFNFYTNDLPGYVVVFGFSYEGEWENVALATDVYLYEPPLLPIPTLTITPMEQSVSSAEGEVSFDYSLEKPIEGESVVVETSASWVTATVESDKIVAKYEANPSAQPRTAELICNYMGIEPVALTLTQEGNADAEPITFDLTIVESHYDYIVVDVAPSDPSTKYALGAILRSDFEKYPYYGSDDVLTEDLLSTYNKPTILSGAQQGYKLEIGASDYTGWDWYVFVYAVDESETIATSAVVRTLVDVVDDTPVLEFETKKLTVPAAGGKFTVKYTLTNGREGGVVRFNGAPMNYYEVIKPNSWTIDTEKCEVSFEVNLYDELLFSHDATIFIAYYASEDATYADATASLKVEQIAE